MRRRLTKFLIIKSKSNKVLNIIFAICKFKLIFFFRNSKAFIPRPTTKIARNDHLLKFELEVFGTIQ